MSRDPPGLRVTIELLEQLDRQGCTMVDTTCGSVLNVWKNVRRYTADGFTSIIHGKFWHEETRATASQAAQDGGHYLVVLDRDEAGAACEYIRRAAIAVSSWRVSAARFLRLRPGSRPRAVGCANQTTMLSSESLSIAEMFRERVRARYGEAELDLRFRTFDTICSATQDGRMQSPHCSPNGRST
jgi:4-hydroxy-3-methylbut-2-enyl diphosphate reductase